MFSMTITVSAAENEMDSNSYDSSNTSVSYPEASTNKIAVNDIYLMDSEDMSFGPVYNPAILRSNSPKYCGLKIKLTKQGDITLSMTATSNKVSLLFVDSNGSIKEKYDYTGRTNEVGQIKLAKVPAGNYYVVIYNKGVTSDTVVSDLYIKSSVIFDITDTSKLKATADFSKNDAIPEYKFKYNGTELKENVDYKVLKTSNSNKKYSGGIEYSFTVEIQGMGNYVGKTSRTFTNSVDEANNKLNSLERSLRKEGLLDAAKEAQIRDTRRSLFDFGQSNSGVSTKIDNSDGANDRPIIKGFSNEARQGTKKKGQNQKPVVDTDFDWDFSSPHKKTQSSSRPHQVPRTNHKKTDDDFFDSGSSNNIQIKSETSKPKGQVTNDDFDF